jgi:hypothetical protein
MDDSTFSRVEPLLLREKLIKIVEEKYALINYELSDFNLEDVFRDMIKENSNVTTLSYLSNNVGKSPDFIKEDAYRLGKKYGVRISDY